MFIQKVANVIFIYIKAYFQSIMESIDTSFFTGISSPKQNKKKYNITSSSYQYLPWKAILLVCDSQSLTSPKRDLLCSQSDQDKKTSN